MSSSELGFERALGSMLLTGGYPSTALAEMKHRDYYAYQAEVRNVGSVQLVFSTTNPKLEKATPDDVKILITNA